MIRSDGKLQLIAYSRDIVFSINITSEAQLEQLKNAGRRSPSRPNILTGIN